MMGFEYRDIPAVRYFKRIIEEGKLGRVYSIVQQTGGSRIADPVKVKREWRMDKTQSGAGALPDFGSHMLDMADHLLSEDNGKICKVHCFKNTFITERQAIDGGGSLPVTNDDAAVFTAVTQKGTLCSFFASRIGMPFQIMQITAEGGMLYYNAQEPKKVGIQFKEKNGGYAGGKKGFEYQDIPAEFFGREGHRGLIEDFVNAVKTGVPDNSRDINQGLYIQYLLDKISESGETGRELNL
jgi:predicted dehydrogenase